MFGPYSKVWGRKIDGMGCFSGRGMGMLCRIEGVMNQNSYQEVLRTSMLPSIEKRYGPNNMRQCIFQQDNAPCHKAVSVGAYLRRAHVVTMEWLQHVSR